MPHSLKTSGVLNEGVSHVCGSNTCLYYLSSSVQPRRGGHIMVHHPEGLCQCGYLWQGVWAWMHLFIYMLMFSFYDTWALLQSSASFDDISSVSTGLKWEAHHVCVEQASCMCPVRLGNTSSGVWQTLLSSLWLITMITRLKELYAYTPCNCCTGACTVHAHVCPHIFYVHKCTLHAQSVTHNSSQSWLLLLLSNSPSGLKMTSKLFLCMCLSVSRHVFVHVCNHACLCVLGCGVYAPWGRWLWEVGPGYRFTPCCLHSPERGQLPLPSCWQGRLQQDTQGRQTKTGHLSDQSDQIQVQSHCH